MDESRLRRPLPSVGIPLLPEERRAARLRAVAAVGGSLLVIALLTGGAVALSVFYERDPHARRDGDGPRDHDESHGASTTAQSTTSPSGEGTSGTTTAAPAPSADTTPSSADRDRDRDRDDGASASTRTQPSPPPAPARPSEPEVTPEGLLRTEVAFGRATSFQAALVNAGLSGAESNEVVRALRGVLDFRRCRPDHTLTIERRGGTRDLHTMRYRGGPLLLVEVTRDPRGRYRGRRVPVPVQRRHVTAGGRVMTNLGDALETSNLRRSLGGVFAEVFNDHLEIGGGRRGDAFRVVVDEEWVNGQFLRYGTVWALEYTDQRTRTARAFYFAPPAEAGETVDASAPRPGEYYDEAGFTMRRRQLAVPVRYDHISSPFDMRRMHPILRRIEPHNGVDYSAAPGTPVWAAADGVVTWAGDRGANGNLVVIRHGAGLETSYAHLRGFAAGIRSGVNVTQRQVIGYVGSTGRSTGPHLHYGVRLNGRWVDPLAMPRSSGRPVPRASQRAFASHARALRAELSRIRVPAAPPAPPPPAAPAATAPAAAPGARGPRDARTDRRGSAAAEADPAAGSAGARGRPAAAGARAGTVARGAAAAARDAAETPARRATPARAATPARTASPARAVATPPARGASARGASASTPRAGSAARSGAAQPARSGTAQPARSGAAQPAQSRRDAARAAAASSSTRAPRPR